LAPITTPPPTTPYLFSLTLHDALPIFVFNLRHAPRNSILIAFEIDDAIEALVTAATTPHRDVPIIVAARDAYLRFKQGLLRDHKIGSTRLNSSHVAISYAVFCLKKKT